MELHHRAGKNVNFIYAQFLSAEELLPTDLLHEMRDRLYPDASDEEMREWYLKCLKEDEDESDSD